MTIILPTTSTAHWLIDTDTRGITQIGELTGVSIGLPVIYAEGENEFLQAIDASNYTPPDLPSDGWLEQGDVYTWNAQTIMVRQSHNRTLFDPDQTPALFIFVQLGDGILEWIIGEQVHVGTVRSYLAIDYQCLQSHVTQADWMPPAVPALWKLHIVIEPVDEWQPGVAYTIDDEVSYLGILYRCRQSHTSQIGWEPPNVLALWLPI